MARSRMARPSDIGELALGLPETAEAVAWGDRPAYQVRGKSFVIYRDARPDALDANGERLTSGCVEPRNGFNHCQTRPNRALGFVFMRDWPTEISQDSIAHEPSDIAIKPRDFTDYRILVHSMHLTQFLSVEERGECGRAHHVDKHNRELSALSLVCERRTRSG